MQKFMLGCFFSVISIAIAATTSVTSAKAETTDRSVTNSSATNNSGNSENTAQYLDSTTPQVIEKISGNTVTFRNAAGESNNYYVPSWMFERYNLQIGTSANLYNRNVIQGIYRDRYIDVLRQGLPGNMSAFAIHETERHCTSSETEGLGVGMRVWYGGGDCPLAIPVVGAMSFYEATPIASSESNDRDSNNTSPTTTDGVSPTTDTSRQEMMRQDRMRNDGLRNDASRTLNRRNTTTPEMSNQDRVRNDALRNDASRTLNRRNTITTPEMSNQDRMRNNTLRNDPSGTMDRQNTTTPDASSQDRMRNDTLRNDPSGTMDRSPTAPFSR